MTIITLTIALLMLVAVSMLVVSGRFGDVFYLALTHGKATLFIVICVSAGALAGLNIRNAGSTPVIVMPDVSLPVLGELYQTTDEKTLITIRNCQAFVTTQLEQANTATPLLHLTSHTTSNPTTEWDHCARSFGTNYWKQDISVKGEKNGGIALCKAYRAQTQYQSGEVDTWCDTVFRADG